MPKKELLNKTLSFPFPELESVQLDPNTAHPMLSITNNGTHVASKILSSIACPRKRKGQQHYMTEDIWTVLGTTGFVSGRHYWEVETQRDHRWYIGVSLESTKGKNQIKDLKGKFFAMSPRRKKETAPGGWWVGVYLAYEEGQVSLYNARNGSLLASWSVQFKEKVYPFFCHAASDTPIASLRIC